MIGTKKRASILKLKVSFANSTYTVECMLGWMSVTRTPTGRRTQRTTSTLYLRRNAQKLTAELQALTHRTCTMDALAMPVGNVFLRNATTASAKI